MPGNNDWLKCLNDTVKEANENEAAVIAKLAAAIINEKSLEKIEGTDTSAAYMIDNILEVATEKEVRMIARVAAAVVGRRKKQSDY